MDQLSRYRIERVDAFTLRFEKWKNRVREDAVGEEVQMRRERENKIWERDSVDESECSWEEEIVDMLLKAGADASLRDDDGETALHKAHKFIKQEEEDDTKKNRWFRRENRSGNEIRENCKGAVAACPEATTVANRRGEKPGEAV